MHYKRPVEEPSRVEEKNDFTILEFLAMPAIVLILAGAFLWSAIKYSFTITRHPVPTRNAHSPTGLSDSSRLASATISACSPPHPKTESGGRVATSHPNML